MTAAVPVRWPARITLDASGEWAARARCRTQNPDALFVRGPSEQRRAKQICSGCPVRFECLAHALDEHIEWGVWGGMTEYERRRLLRRYPQTRNWRRILECWLNAWLAQARGQRAAAVNG